MITLCVDLEARRGPAKGDRATPKGDLRDPGGEALRDRGAPGGRNREAPRGRAATDRAERAGAQSEATRPPEEALKLHSDKVKVSF